MIFILLLLFGRTVKKGIATKEKKRIKRRRWIRRTRLEIKRDVKEVRNSRGNYSLIFFF